MKLTAILLLVLLAVPGWTQLTPERVDLDAVAKITAEAIQHSQVMDIASYLTDVHGPRLTGSPNIKAAAGWVTTKMNEWKLSGVKLETWGPFGRGWTNDRFYSAMVKPYPFPLIGHPKAWTPGTNGTITGEAVLAVVVTQNDIDKYRGKLRGKLVMAMQPRDLPALFAPVATRFSEDQLETLRNPPPPRGGAPRAGGQRNLTLDQRNQFYLNEGVLAVIEHGNASGGNAIVQGGGDYRTNARPVPVQIVLSTEHYAMVFRNLQKNIPVTLELNIQNQFHDEDVNSFNIIGEIPGTDKAAEVVMLGAHFDSWNAGTGATDNAAGSAIMLEAMRILKATGVPLRRTVRVALWTGEEQGLLGSLAYVKQHFADRQTMQLKPEHAGMSVYFNVDNGTGQIRGVYLQGNEGARPVFDSWMQPFKTFGMNTLSTRGTGGTDHANFDAVGLPGFQFIQDPIEYDTRTHHASFDVYERLQTKDMMQNAAIVASFVYNAANRDELFPRKPLPPPPPPPGQRGAAQ